MKKTSFFGTRFFSTMCSACTERDVPDGVMCPADVMRLRAWVERITSLCGENAKHHFVVNK